jgi:hypothetical protein
MASFQWNFLAQLLVLSYIGHIILCNLVSCYSRHDVPCNKVHGIRIRIILIVG